MNVDEIGQLAEEIALQEVISETPPHLRPKIRDVSRNFGLGYDIEAFEEINGCLRLKAIEVKAWNKNGNFIISANEIKVISSLGCSGWIYIVDIGKRKIIHKINEPFGKRSFKIEPYNFKFYY